VWWPRQPRKPVRCPGCKSPYWDKPRRLRQAVTPLTTSVNKEAITNSLGQTLTNALGRGDADHQGDHNDRSLAHALTVLKEMKAAGRTWQEMADRLEREFGTKLEKDQLKALIR
jgi:cell wall assembly regulator SMI1